MKNNIRAASLRDTCSNAVSMQPAISSQIIGNVRRASRACGRGSFEGIAVSSQLCCLCSCGVVAAFYSPPPAAERAARLGLCEDAYIEGVAEIFTGGCLSAVSALIYFRKKRKRVRIKMEIESDLTMRSTQRTVPLSRETKGKGPSECIFME